MKLMSRSARIMNNRLNPPAIQNRVRPSDNFKVSPFEAEIDQIRSSPLRLGNNIRLTLLVRL